MPAPRYQILERVDAGGMAEVFRGKVSTVEGIEKLVAVKRVLPSLTQNEKFVGMFLDEARVAMHLSHANIVHVYDVGKSDDTYYIVMEYVDGVNLKAVMERNARTARRLPIALTLYVLSEVCKALSYAHALRDLQGHPLGIVHRDVSPPNVLLSRAGEVKLADFGLAKAHSQVEATDPGIVKGKFSYLSPEASFGEVVDQRSDVFSAGIILWELIAGRRLFYGDSDMETLEQVRKCRVPPLAGMLPDVGGELSAIVVRALSADPVRRWQTARDLGDALIRYLFSRGLAVSSQDVAALVEAYLAGEEAPQDLRSATPSPVSGRRRIDSLVREEMAHFESLPGVRGRVAPIDDDYDGTEPLAPDDAGTVLPRRPTGGSFEDPRTWDIDEGSDPRVKAARTPTRAPSPLRRPGVHPPLRPPPAAPAAAGAAEPAPRAEGSAQTPVAAVPLWIVVLLMSVVMFLSVTAMYFWMANSLSQ